jgi:hypothetical protein
MAFIEEVISSQEQQYLAVSHRSALPRHDI